MPNGIYMCKKRSREIRHGWLGQNAPVPDGTMSPRWGNLPQPRIVART